MGSMAGNAVRSNVPPERLPRLPESRPGRLVLAASLAWLSVIAAGAEAHPAESFESTRDGGGFFTPIRQVWEEHPAAVTAGALAVAVQSILITGLLIHRQRRMRAEQQLRVSEER